jgi:hypothetical protein
MLTDLDRAALSDVRGLLQKRVEQHERFNRKRPSWDLVAARSTELIRTVSPALMEGPRAIQERGQLALIRALEEAPAKQEAADRERESILASARRRTEMLRAWLESLS